MSDDLPLTLFMFRQCAASVADLEQAAATLGRHAKQARQALEMRRDMVIRRAPDGGGQEGIAEMLPWREWTCIRGTWTPLPSPDPEILEEERAELARVLGEAPGG